MCPFSITSTKISIENSKIEIYIISNTERFNVNIMFCHITCKMVICVHIKFDYQQVHHHSEFWNMIIYLLLLWNSLTFHNVCLNLGSYCKINVIITKSIPKHMLVLKRYRNSVLDQRWQAKTKFHNDYIYNYFLFRNIYGYSFPFIKKVFPFLRKTL